MILSQKQLFQIIEKGRRLGFPQGSGLFSFVRDIGQRTHQHEQVSGHIDDRLLGSSGALLVDLKGIEPSNLTDANRALSQLSYRPIFSTTICIIAYQIRFVKPFSARNGSFLPTCCRTATGTDGADTPRHRPSAEPPGAGPILHNTEPPAPIRIGADGLPYALSTKIWESKSQAAGSSG